MKPHEEPHTWEPMFKGTQSQCRKFAAHLKAAGETTRITRGTGFYTVHVKKFKLHRFKERW